MRGKRFDVVIAQYTPLLPLKLVSLIRRTPIVAVFHDVYGLESSIEQKGLFRGLIRYVFGDLLITRLRYDGIVAVSEATERKLRRFRSKTTQIKVVRNAVDVDLIDSIAALQIPKQICFVGRLLKLKHVDDLLLSFARVLKREPNAKLIVIGDGDEKGRLVSLAQQIGIGGSVNFTGFVEDKKKIRLMKSSELLVLPSTDEGWGNVITEAIACGLNTISYDIPALREQTRFFHSIVLVPPHNLVALARAIEHSLSQVDHHTVVADSAKVRSDFTWMRRAEELEQFLYQVTKRRD
jgi:glycosyltransferase involved in cell wall biosynthesis